MPLRARGAHFPIPDSISVSRCSAALVYAGVRDNIPDKVSWAIHVHKVEYGIE